jgi:flavin reductase (DIM6/NTAB) family NADH-FMN oxidoreductase RutF
VPISADEFKAALATRACAVAVVTARAGDRVHGMTVTDWAGVSVDPPLALVCADKKSNTLGVMDAGGCFAINVLARGQEALSNKFASNKDEWSRFEGLDVEEGTTGAPLIRSAIVSLDCRVVASHEAGDHWIYVGEIEHVTLRGGEPLLYCDGSYRELAGSA